MEYKFGALEPKVDIRDYKFEPTSMATKDDNLPYEFSLNPPDVKNQKNVSSCVAHVAAEIEEYYNRKQQNSNEELSVGYIYGCRYDYMGEGMYLRDALKTLKNRGISTYSEFPYNREVPAIIELFENQKEWKTDSKNKISTYFSIDGDNIEYKIKKALFDYGPVMVSVKWYNDFIVNNDDIIESSLAGDFGYHCIMIYGWNEKGWLIQNSWGEAWGNKGRAVYPYEYPLNEIWGITDTIVYNDDIKTTNNNNLTDILCKIINAIINLINHLKTKH